NAVLARLEESHRHADQEIASVAPLLKREPCDFAEYHCVLMAGALARTPGLFDEKICCVHEHIDAALSARKLGFSVYFEPAAAVTYWASAPYRLSELDFFRMRWASSAVEASIARFASKWQVADAGSIAEVRTWARRHLVEADPLRIDAA